jgi:hypothetical protein
MILFVLHRQPPSAKRAYAETGKEIAAHHVSLGFFGFTAKAHRSRADG